MKASAVVLLARLQERHHPLVLSMPGMSLQEDTDPSEPVQ